jgi:hypothetical protein
MSVSSGNSDANIEVALKDLLEKVWIVVKIFIDFAIYGKIYRN